MHYYFDQRFPYEMSFEAYPSDQGMPAWFLSADEPGTVLTLGSIEVLNTSTNKFEQSWVVVHIYNVLASKDEEIKLAKALRRIYGENGCAHLRVS